MEKLFIPGPVNVNQEVAQLQTQPMLPHRSAEFEDIFRQAEIKLRKIFKTQTRIFITTSSGTGLHEAAVRNLANQRVLSCINGAFGKRWHDVALTNGKQADPLETAWNQPITPQAVKESLTKNKYEILTIVHNETSTGLVNPIAEIAAMVRAESPQTLVCVDAVSSLGGMDIQTDAWNLDMVLTSSQKCLALPPGLGFAAINDRAMERAGEIPERGWYFDFLRMEKHRLKDSSPATPAISLIYSLLSQLDRILTEGLEERFARHQEMAKLVQNWAHKNDFGLYAPKGYRSNTVTTIHNTHKVDITSLNNFLFKRSMRIANGYGPLKNDTFRIGHMGELQTKDIEILLRSLETYLGI
jgi:aspartate aminotransferase-like enzyme